jgi:hypothetical protein
LLDDLLNDHLQSATSLRDARSLTAVRATAQLLDVLPRTKSIAPIADAVVALEAELRQQQTTISNGSFDSRKRSTTLLHVAMLCALRCVRKRLSSLVR